jgi:hypothetical protein
LHEARQINLPLRTRRSEFIRAVQIKFALGNLPEFRPAGRQFQLPTSQLSGFKPAFDVGQQSELLPNVIEWRYRAAIMYSL